MAIFSVSGGAAPAGARSALPAAAALWFAFVLGLGSLMLPAALIERVTFASDITARALIALAVASVGAVAGLALARGVAAGHDRHPPMPVPRPINVHEELSVALDWVGPEVSEALQDPVNPSLRHASLVELIERLRIVVEHRHAALAASIHVANAGVAMADTEAALRASLARLRQLRGVA